VSLANTRRHASTRPIWSRHIGDPILESNLVEVGEASEAREGNGQAVLDYAPPGARLVFSYGWHITLDGQDVYSRKLKALVKILRDEHNEHAVAMTSRSLSLPARR
jgi:hypothetical protein